MSATAKIGKDVFRGDSYTVNLVGPIPLIDVKDCIKVSSTTRTAKKIDLPDYSVAPGPVVEAGEIDLTFPAHSSNITILDSIFNATSNGVVPIGATANTLTITQISNSLTKIRTTLYTNCWILSKTEPDLDFQGADKMTEITYKFCYDQSSDI